MLGKSGNIKNEYVVKIKELIFNLEFDNVYSENESGQVHRALPY